MIYYIISARLTLGFMLMRISFMSFAVAQTGQRPRKFVIASIAHRLSVRAKPLGEALTTCLACHLESRESEHLTRIDTPSEENVAER